MLSNYIVKTKIDGEEVLFDTTQKKSLPVNSSNDTLKANLFCEGQEKEALYARLFSHKPRALLLNVMPTWKCNLRCTHCCVIDRLVKKESSRLDAVKVLGFIQRHYDRYGTKQFHLRFAGGEPLLDPDVLLKLFNLIGEFKNKNEVVVTYNITTNLAMDLGSKELDALKQFDVIGISIDGLGEVHNSQRKDVDKSLNNPFERTMWNLKKLMLLGMREQIYVQGAVKDEHLNDIESYYKTMISMGVIADRIKYTCINPTKANPSPGKRFLEIIQSQNRFENPCCKYQYMENFTVDSSNKVFTDFYVFTELGNLDDSMEHFEAASKNSILQEMPAIKDSKCLSCPVIGFCWGGCSLANVAWLDNPSKYCNQELLINKVSDWAASGNLTVLKDY